MAKLLIVDDERTTRESLTTYIPWADLSIGTVRAARNGIEALSLAALDPPDLLITDVRMPKMDGIALAEKVRTLYPRCKIIFLSGYADKEYLKKAISLRAVGYIEKPIDPVEVEEVARSAISLCQEEERNREELARARSQEEIARSLIRGEKNVAAERRGTGPLARFTDDCPFTVAALLLRWDRSLEFTGRETARKQILAACRGLPLSDQPSTFFGFTEMDVCAVVVAAKLPENSPKARALFPALIREVAALRAQGFSWSLGVGTPVTGVPGIPRSYESALQSARLAFYRGFGKVLFPSPSRGGHFGVSREDLASLRGMLRDNDGERAVVLVNRLSETARTEEFTDIDSVRNAFFDLLLTVFEAARATRGLNPFGDTERTYVWQEIHERASLQELSELVRDNLQAVFTDAQPRARESRTVREIKRFLREHYASPGLSLQAIADHVRLSRTYVSFLFKSVTGENINDWITRLRIARAKELLRDGGIKTCEAAFRVGYADSNYFSTTFRKHVGMSPTEFRENAGETP